VVELLFVPEFPGAQAAPAIADMIINSANNFNFIMSPESPSPSSNRGPTRTRRAGR
jgi:hypothetical protein